MRYAQAILFLAIVGVSSPAWPQAPQDIVQSYAGRKLILRHHGQARNVELKKKDLGKRGGDCDIAVEVKEARFDKGKARFGLERIGSLVVAGEKVCGVGGGETTLAISGFGPDEPASALATALGQILMTPGTYLVADGITFDLPAAPADEPVVDKWQAGMVAPRAVLAVNAAYPDKAARERRQGVVLILVIVGTDGRVRNARLAKRVGWGLDEQALRVLPLWRFEPARQDGHAVALRTTIEMNFRLH